MINNPKMQLAKKLSFKSTHRVRIGAVVVKGKSIVGLGFNKQTKTHPLISKNSHKKLHAEIDSLIGNDRKQLEGATMYVYREQRDGKLGNCRPCVDCQVVLKEVGIKQVFYTIGEKEGVGELKP